MSNQKKKCTRPGCNATYTDDQNIDGACVFHVGTPVFHEGKKAWSCCNTKKVLTFEEFMEIPGCAIGTHTDESTKKVELVSPTRPQDSGVKKVSADNNGVEVYSTGSAPLTKSVGSVAPAPPAQPEYADVPYEEDPADAVIEVGTKCRRNGCNAVYKGKESRTEDCYFHPGAPLFHEAVKGWTCCRTRKTEWEDFLQIEGCLIGKHKFLPFAKEAMEADQVKCRYDWYQSATSVFVSVFAKNVAQNESKIVIEPAQVDIKLKFKDGKQFTKVLKLPLEVASASSKIDFGPSKVEITLRKKYEGESWSQLEIK